MSLLLRIVDVADSTNDLVRDALVAGTLGHGEAIQALEQRAGRGRRGRSWHSPAGQHVYLSVAVARPIPAALAGWLPLAAGVAAAEVAASLVEATVCLKWPNDVLCDGRKLAGVLCEGVAGTAGLRGAVVGVGLNVGAGALPADLAPRATSLAEHGADVDVREVGAALRLAIVRWSDQLIDGDRAAVAEAWRARDATTGRWVLLPDGREGDAEGLADDGALLVSVGGERVAVRAGEVQFVGGTQGA